MNKEDEKIQLRAELFNDLTMESGRRMEAAKQQEKPKVVYVSKKENKGKTELIG